MLSILLSHSGVRRSDWSSKWHVAACCAGAPGSTTHGTCGLRSGTGTRPEDRFGLIGFRCVVVRAASLDPLFC